MAGSGERRARAHAFTAEDAEAHLRRLMPGLEVFCGGPAGIGRALRHARKAARAGEAGYDPVRHAALARLLRASEGRPRAPAAGARGQAQRPSNRAVER